jgi:hypothetical protein
VPNSTWITITSGATGTATNAYPEGSFSLSSASNSQDASLLGAVTVMDQTLNVVVGDPVGTPGTGSITIDGSPKSTYVCRPGCSVCLSKSCSSQVYESGTVGVSIGGDYYYANYSGTEASGQIASALASAINAGSLVSASVSGSTVYLTAVAGVSSGQYEQIYERDTCVGAASGCTPSTARVSVTYDGPPPNFHSKNTAISTDGRYVAFDSQASNILPSVSPCGVAVSGPAQLSCVYLRDSCTGVTSGCTPNTT